MERITWDEFDAMYNAIICGYKVSELVIFAHACMEQGIENEDLHNFCVTAGTAVEYAYKVLGKQIADVMAKNIEKGEQDELKTEGE